MKEVGKKVAKPERKYKVDFVEKICPPQEAIEPRNFVFMRKEFYEPHGEKHKLALVTKRFVPGSVNIRYYICDADGSIARDSITGQSS